MYGYLYCENEGLEWLLDDIGFTPNLSIDVEKYVSYASETLPICPGACLHIKVHAYICMPRVSFDLYFSKIDFLLNKKLYFPV